MAVLLVDVGLAIYILPKDPAMDLFIYSDGVQVDFTIGGVNIFIKCVLNINLDAINTNAKRLKKHQ